MAAIVVGAACGGRTPLSPDSIDPSHQVGVQNSNGRMVLTGWVYESTPLGTPPIVDAVIRVVLADGSTREARSAEDGSYVVPIQPGGMRISAFKDGYQPKTIRAIVVSDSVLNFGLTPIG